MHKRTVLRGLATRTRTTALLTAGAIASISLAGCGGGDGGSATKGSDDTLTIAILTAPQSMNPGQVGGGGTNLVQMLAYEPLIRMHSDGSYSPGLATKWEYVGPKRDTFKLTLREGAKFADGSPVTAKSVADTLNYYVATPGTFSRYLLGVQQAKAVGNTVEVSLNQANPILPTVFSQAVNFGDVISPAGLKDPDQLNSNTFGAGPYTLDKNASVDGDHYTLVPNKKYWNPDAVKYGKVVVRIMSDQQAAYQALQTGQIDVDYNANPVLADKAKGDSLDVTEGMGTVMGLNLLDRDGKKVKALGDVRVRQALNYAVDRDALAKVMGTGYSPTQQIAPEGTVGYDESLNSTYSYDQDKAKDLLKQAGVADGFSMPLVTTSLFRMDTLTQAVAPQLEKVGVKTETKSVGVDAKKFVTDLASQQYATAMWTMTNDMFSNSLLAFASPLSPLNPYKSNGKEVMDPFNALASSDAAGLEDASVALNTAVTKSAWFVPLVQSSSYFLSKGVGNTGSIGEMGLIDVLDFEPAS